MDDVTAIRLAGDTFYFPGPTNTGYRNGILIDPGVADASYVRHEIADVLITHGHADHFSTAAAVRRATNARVVAPREEATFVENPEVNVRGMFSWAKPSDEMVTKLFRGEGCRVDAFVDEWRAAGVEAIPLPGHTLGHTGFLTDDGVLFTGDALYVRDLWERHALPYTIDIGMLQASLALIEKLEPAWVVPGHGTLASGEDVAGHVRHHLERLDAILGELREMLVIPTTTEDSIAGLCERLRIRESPSQYWLAVTTVKAFLSHLLERGEIEFYVEGHRGYWRAV